jgi:hypothetical protein
MTLHTLAIETAIWATVTITLLATLLLLGRINISLQPAPPCSDTCLTSGA